MRKRSLTEQAGGPNEGMSAALVRGLDVLRAFRLGDATLGNLEIAERTGLPKATVSRITFTLTTLGYLTYDPSLGRYALGAATVALGYAALGSSAVVQVARPLMQQLADRTGAAVALGARNGLEMVYLCNCRSESPVSLRLNAGAHVPLWRTSMGLAQLAGSDETEAGELVERLVAVDPAEGEAIRAAVKGAHSQFASVGYVASFGAWHRYINAVGVPFHPRDGSPAVSITCGGISEIVSRERVRDEFGPALIELARTLAARLGGKPCAANLPDST